jgi:hypothetical protein
MKKIRRYVFLIIVPAVTVLIAAMLPKIVYSIYDIRRFSTSSVEDSRITDISQLNVAYNMDRQERIAAFAKGYEAGKKYVTTETELDDEELDNMAINVFNELEKIFLNAYESYGYEMPTDKNADSSTTSVSVVSENAYVDKNGVSMFKYLNEALDLGDISGLYMSMEDAYAHIDRPLCKKYIVYDESMEDGIAFALFYMEIVGTDSSGQERTIILADAYDYTIYYIEFQYPDLFMDSYGFAAYIFIRLYEGTNYNNFYKAMQIYFSSDDISEPVTSQIFEVTQKKYFTMTLPFNNHILRLYVENSSPDKDDDYRAVGYGIKEIMELVY